MFSVNSPDRNDRREQDEKSKYIYVPLASETVQGDEQERKQERDRAECLFRGDIGPLVSLAYAVDRNETHLGHLVDLDIKQSDFAFRFTSVHTSSGFSSGVNHHTHG